MSKSLCKTSRKKKKILKDKKPKYKCKLCDEQAHKKKHLCKPVKI